MQVMTKSVDCLFLAALLAALSCLSGRTLRSAEPDSISSRFSLYAEYSSLTLGGYETSSPWIGSRFVFLPSSSLSGLIEAGVTAMHGSEIYFDSDNKNTAVVLFSLSLGFRKQIVRKAGFELNAAMSVGMDVLSSKAQIPDRSDDDDEIWLRGTDGHFEFYGEAAVPVSQRFALAPFAGVRVGFTRGFPSGPRIGLRLYMGL